MREGSFNNPEPARATVAITMGAYRENSRDPGLVRIGDSTLLANDICHSGRRMGVLPDIVEATVYDGGHGGSFTLAAAVRADTGRLPQRTSVSRSAG